MVIWWWFGCGLGGDLGGFDGGLVWMFLGLCGCGGGLGADFGLGVDVVWMFLVFRKKKIFLPKLHTTGFGKMKMKVGF